MLDLHPDRAALLRAIIADPAADLPRLVYADWLDDHGDRTGWAALIRRQCDGYMGSPSAYVAAKLFDDPYLGRAHWHGDGPHILYSNGHSTIQAAVARGFVAAIKCTLQLWAGDTCTQCYFACAGQPRAYGVRCPLCLSRPFFRGIGRAVVARHPIQIVGATDREPLPVAGSWLWLRQCIVTRGTPFPEAVAALPDEVFDLLPDRTTYTHEASYPTRESALSSASAAFIRFACPLASTQAA